MKYEKPILINLCQEVGTGQTCSNGAQVEAGTCRNRGFGATVDCRTGTSPGGASGCRTGGNAQASCTTGPTPSTTCSRGSNVTANCTGGSGVSASCTVGGSPTS